MKSHRLPWPAAAVSNDDAVPADGSGAPPGLAGFTGSMGLLRRPLVLGAGSALLAALAGCSKDVEKPDATPAAAAATGAAPARQSYEEASRGTGFTVGQSMAARSVLVFFDPQCPHCATLWLASKPLHDRIRMVWMPVAFIRPVSGPQGALLLAASDPVKLMDQHESLLAGGAGGLAVSGAADGDLLDKVKANTALWTRLDGQSVPHLIYRAGAEGPYGTQSGGLPTAQLAQLLGL
ncbi:MAG: DsbC family protein [Rubrivivax sp.]|nr:DsbC family protein [Rubrivivax sp.]